LINWRENDPISGFKYSYQFVSFQAHSSCLPNLPASQSVCQFGLLEPIFLPPQTISIPRAQLTSDKVLSKNHALMQARKYLKSALATADHDKQSDIATAGNGYSLRGSKFCFVVLLVLADTLIRILHYCPISPCFQHFAPLHAALPGSLPRQPCPADLPGSLAW
jgi:hypothetical protein